MQPLDIQVIFVDVFKSIGYKNSYNGFKSIH